MIGIFDSGRGGEVALGEFRKLMPKEDVIFLADRGNAPYGTKTEEELIALAERNIKRLASLGCRRVLIACCTASTVYRRLCSEAKRISIPIIRPVADEAVHLTKRGRIGVIATEATVRSRAFSRALAGIEVLEVAAGRLVSEVECGACDGNVSPSLSEYLTEVLRPIAEFGPDVLILGCTHFPRLDKTVSGIMQSLTGEIITTVSSAKTGALALYRVLCKHPVSESGSVVYI